MSGIKDYFISRYKDGWIIEADYKQLEIVALAILSGDAALKNDLNNKIDLHTRNAADLFNTKEALITKEERRIAKSLSFQLQYGAGANSMAKKLTLDVVLCKKFIAQYYTRYPGVKMFQEAMKDKVLLNRLPGTDGYGVSKVQSPTGRIYTYHEEDSAYNTHPTFRPTQYKNYPIQGFAADIVLMMLGELLFVLKKELLSTVKMCNTIHDSILFDCPNGLLPVACKRIKEVLDNTAWYVRNRWGIVVDVPLEVDIKIGKTWGTMEPYKYET